MILMNNDVYTCGACKFNLNGYCSYLRKSGVKHDSEICNFFKINGNSDVREMKENEYCGNCGYFNYGTCIAKNMPIDFKKSACNYWINPSTRTFITISDLIILQDKMISEKKYRIRESYKMKPKSTMEDSMRSEA